MRDEARVWVTGAWPVEGKANGWARSDATRVWLGFNNGWIVKVKSNGLLLPAEVVQVKASTVAEGREKLKKRVYELVTKLASAATHLDPGPSYMVRIVVDQDVGAERLKRGFRVYAHLGMGITRSERAWDDREIRLSDQSSFALSGLPTFFQLGLPRR